PSPRTRVLRGAGHPLAKFSDEAIRTAIRMTRAGYPRTEIRAVTGLSFAHISTVCRGVGRADLMDSGDTVTDIAALIASCQNLGAVLRWARGKCGISQQGLADAVGVDVNTMSRWEREIRTPHPSSIRKIAAALGMSAE